MIKQDFKIGEKVVVVKVLAQIAHWHIGDTGLWTEGEHVRADNIRGGLSLLTMAKDYYIFRSLDNTENLVLEDIPNIFKK